MIDKHLLHHEWGVWFCFLNDSNDPNDKYEENYRQLFSLTTPADFAYCWSQCGLNNLENFLVNAENKQKTYSLCDSAT